MLKNEVGMTVFVSWSMIAAVVTFFSGSGAF
jgi:hypothetical protein